MKIGDILKTNKKGQLVIPKKLRKTLGIDPDTPLNIVARGNGLYIYPIKDLVRQGREEQSYLKILEKTKGTWQGGALSGTGQKSKFELEASRRRKTAW